MAKASKFSDHPEIKRALKQQAQLNGDLAVSQRVIALADTDMDKLSAAIQHAEKICRT